MASSGSGGVGEQQRWDLTSLSDLQPQCAAFSITRRPPGPAQRVVVAAAATQQRYYRQRGGDQERPVAPGRGEDQRPPRGEAGRAGVPEGDVSSRRLGSGDSQQAGDSNRRAAHRTRRSRHEGLPRRGRPAPGSPAMLPAARVHPPVSTLRAVCRSRACAYSVLPYAGTCTGRKRYIGKDSNVQA